MKRHFTSALYIFGTINLAIWTAVSLHFAWNVLKPSPPKIACLWNGAYYVEWSDGRQEYLEKRGGGVEFAPTDEG